MSNLRRRRIQINLESKLNVPSYETQQIVGRERRERLSHHDWSGGA